MTPTYLVSAEQYYDIDLQCESIRYNMRLFVRSHPEWKQIDLRNFRRRVDAIPKYQLFRGPYTFDIQDSEPRQLTLELDTRRVGCGYLSQAYMALQDTWPKDVATEIMARLACLMSERRFPYTDWGLMRGVIHCQKIQYCYRDSCSRPFYVTNTSRYDVFHVRSYCSSPISALRYPQNQRTTWRCTRSHQTFELPPGVNVLARHRVKDRIHFLNLPFLTYIQTHVELCTDCTFYCIGEYTVSSWVPFE